MSAWEGLQEIVETKFKRKVLRLIMRCKNRDFWSINNKVKRGLKMKKNRLNKDVKDTYFRNKPLAINGRRFIYFGSFKKHLKKVMDEALRDPVNETS